MVSKHPTGLSSPAGCQTSESFWIQEDVVEGMMLFQNIQLGSPAQRGAKLVNHSVGSNPHNVVYHSCEPVNYIEYMM